MTEHPNFRANFSLFSPRICRALPVTRDVLRAVVLPRLSPPWDHRSWAAGAGAAFSAVLARHWTGGISKKGIQLFSKCVGISTTLTRLWTLVWRITVQQMYTFKSESRDIFFVILSILKYFFKWVLNHFSIHYRIWVTPCFSPKGPKTTIFTADLKMKLEVIFI